MKHEFSCPQGHVLRLNVSAEKRKGGFRIRCPKCAVVFVPPFTSEATAAFTVDFGAGDATAGSPRATESPIPEQTEALTLPPRLDRSDDCGELPPPVEQSSNATEAFDSLQGATQDTLGYVSTRSAHAVVNVPGYEILSELGRGGMGVVYQARQTRLNRVVALKMILSGGHAGASELERFRTEAEAIARLHHPNIVQIFEIGDHDGLPYFSLEFCPGGSLDRKLARTPMPPEEAASLVHKLAQAMHAAHEKDVIHRDLKPANVLLLEDGTPKITDFGLAKKLDEQGKTATGAVMGTPSYMSPEQAGGKGAQIGPSCDIYALGAILYDCLTGRPPFRAATPLDTILQVISDEPAPVSQLNRQVPRDLETICLKCLRKDPAKRYRTAYALAEDLRRFTEGEPIQARRSGVRERVIKWVRRRPAVAASLGIGILAALATVAFVVRGLHNARLQEALNQTEEQRQRAEGLKEEADKQRRLARQYLHFSRVGLAARAWDDAQIHRMEELLRQEIPFGEEEDLRNFEWHYLWRTLNASQKILTGHAQAVNATAWSPDRTLLATASFDGTVRIWDAASYRLLRVLTNKGSFSDLAFGPNGQLAASSFDGSIRIYDTKTGNLIHTLMDHTDRVNGVAWSRDGRRLASASWDQTIGIWDPESGKKLLTLKGHTYGIDGVAFSPNNRYLASSALDKTVKVWDVYSGTLLANCVGHTAAVQRVAWSPDGTRIVSSSSDRTIRIWSPLTGTSLMKLQGHTGLVRGIAFDPMGGTLVSGSIDGTIRKWNAKTGEEAGILRGHRAGVYGVSISPDGMRIASGSFDGTVRIWNINTDQDSRILHGLHGHWTEGLAFRPDGKQLALASGAQEIVVWNVTTGRPIRLLKGHQAGCHGVAFHPSGKQLASASEDGTVRIWNPASGTQERVLIKGDRHQYHVAYSPDGSYLVTSTGWRWFIGGENLVRPAQIKVWRTSDWSEVASLQGHKAEVTRLCFPREGNRLATASFDGTVKTWSLVDGQELSSLKLEPSPPTGLAYHPSGQYLATGTFKGVIQIWEVDTGRLVQTFQGHTENVMSLAFSPDGTRLASSSHDTTIKLWDPMLGQELFTFRAHKEPVQVVVFSPDGSLLVSGPQNSTIRVWDAAPR